MSQRAERTAAARDERTDRAFRALADGTRRRMLDLLAARGQMSVGELAAEFPDLVASGISKHLMVLRAAGLVVAETVGRSRIYRVDGDGFNRALTPWLRRYEAFWDRPFDALKALAEVSEPPDDAPVTRGTRRRRST